MTAQIEDSLMFNGDRYALKSNLKLIHPERWGIEPRMMHTGCRRGWYAQVAIIDKQLMLMSMTVRAQNPEFSTINNIAPTVSEHGRASYENLRLPLQFTGNLLAAKDFDSRHYRHMGFHPIGAYGTVLRLELEAGIVQSQTVRQQDTRKNPIDDPLSPMPQGPTIRKNPPMTTTHEQPSGDSLLDWIKKRFSRPS